jgi:hypothetical protein
MSASLQRGFASLAVAACVGCAAPDALEKRVSPEVPRAEVRPALPVEPLPAPALRAAPTAPTLSKADHELARGIQSYEEGEHKRAAKELQSALDLGLESKRDRAKAHKYLAFIVCVSGREKACRDQFRLALDADPTFALEPAEAGNRAWSSALRAVKTERAKKKVKPTP